MKNQVREVWEVLKFALKISLIAGVVFLIATSVNPSGAFDGKLIARGENNGIQPDATSLAAFKQGSKKRD